ncbi:MAG TPA: hypothetical protein VK915_05800 [Gaiellaceae bacterium]|nr:hypothetical protein [Gaiellaceae bacterium]
MVEPRPYRRPLEAEEALRELSDHAGTQFDPACVEAILHVLGEREAAPVLKLHRPGDPPDTRERQAKIAANASRMTA